jgi:hypothetical protein
MANKFAFGLVLSGAVAAVGITITQKIQEHVYYSTPAPVVAEEVAPSVAATEIALSVPETSTSSTEASETTTSFRSSLSYTDRLLYDAAQRQVNQCDQDWLPSTCAKMRAEFKAEFGWDL